MADPDTVIDDLVHDLEAARGGLLDAIARLDAAQLNADRLIGEWGLREVIAHLGYWAGHAAEALHHAEQDRLDEFGEPEIDVEALNEVVARVARESDLRTVQAREEAAFTALVARLGRADPAWLDERVSYGDSLGDVIRDDGADHYREHALELLDLVERGAE
jgi:hypothetical protein